MCSCTTPTQSAQPTADGISYQVAGMTCGSCAMKVENAVKALPGVTDISVDITTGQLTVVGDMNGEDVSSAVEAAGYRIQPANT